MLQLNSAFESLLFIYDISLRIIAVKVSRTSYNDVILSSAREPSKIIQYSCKSVI